MPKLSVYNISGQPTGEEIELNEVVFGVEFNEAVVHQAIVMQHANQRQGTAATKTRGLVRGGGRKPWKQKGTGRARSGSTRSPLWVGGGTVFGPQPRSYDKKMPRKARRLAIGQKILGLPVIAIYKGGEKVAECVKDDATVENIKAMIEDNL